MTNEEALQIIYDHCQHCDETEKALEILKENKGEWISIDDVMSVFDDFMCGEVDEDGTATFLEMLKDKVESETKDWVDKEMAKKYGFFIREEDRLKKGNGGEI